MTQKIKPNFFPIFLITGFVWVQSSHGEKVIGAVEGGSKPGEMYIGRAPHQDELVPGKVHRTHGVLYIPWGEREHAKKKYEVLTAKGNSKYDWIPSSNGQVPSGAIPGGKTSAGEVLYIGRTLHVQGVVIPGKVHPSQRCLYVAYDGKEHAHEVGYQILVAVSGKVRGKVRSRPVGQQPNQQFQDSDIEGDDRQQSGAGYPPRQQPDNGYPLQQHPGTGYPPPQQPVTTAASLSPAAQTTQSAGKILRICTIMLVKSLRR